MSTFVIIVLCAVIAWIIFAALIVTIISMNSSNISKEKELAWLKEVLRECEEERDGCKGNGER